MLFFDKTMKPVSITSAYHLYCQGELVGEIKPNYNGCNYRVYKEHYGNELRIYSGSVLTVDEAKEALQEYFTA